MAVNQPQHKSITQNIKSFITWGIIPVIALLYLVGPQYKGWQGSPQPLATSSPSVMSLEVLRLVAKSTPTASVIFLHGMGDSAQGWKFFAEQVQNTPHLNHINFVLPTAPVREISLFQTRTTGWFNIVSQTERADKQGLEDSLNVVKQLIAAEIKNGIPADRIVVGGFSQGAALTEATAVTLSTKIAGLAAISGFLPRADELVDSKLNLDTPFLITHGSADPMIVVSRAKDSVATLKQKGFKDVTFNVYSGVQHTLGAQGANDLIAFLDKTIGK